MNRREKRKRKFARKHPYMKPGESVFAEAKRKGKTQREVRITRQENFRRRWQRSIG